MSLSEKYKIDIKVKTFYIEEQSDPDNDRFVFAYTIRIKNTGSIAAQLITRHWIIEDTNAKKTEVRGEGVVGEQPHLACGESFEYTSGTVIETSVGTMYGSYRMVADDGTEFDAEIPVFTLSIPRTLH